MSGGPDRLSSPRNRASRAIHRLRRGDCGVAGRPLSNAGGLLAFGADRICGLAVNGVIAHPARSSMRSGRRSNHLENDERGDGVVDDDERRALELRQKLARVAVEQAGNADAGRFLVGADVFEHVRRGEDADQQTAHRPAMPCVENTPSVSSTLIMKLVFWSLFMKATE